VRRQGSGRMDQAPARSAGSLPAGRLPAGPGDPLDEPGWSLGSEDQAGNHGDDQTPAVVLLRTCWYRRADPWRRRLWHPSDVKPRRTPIDFAGQGMA
jgi:hypothetical protein